MEHGKTAVGLADTKLLFESPTVADMAVVITQNQAKKVRQEEQGRMLGELESPPDEQAERRLADEIGLSESDQRVR